MLSGACDANSVQKECDATPMSYATVSHFMKLALQVAEAGLESREVPVGCLMVHMPSGTILAADFNHTNEKLNATRHCEVECFAQIEYRIRQYIVGLRTSPLRSVKLESDFASSEDGEVSTLWKSFLGCSIRPLEDCNRTQPLTRSLKMEELPYEWCPNENSVRAVLSSYFADAEGDRAKSVELKVETDELNDLLFQEALPILITSLRQRLLRDTAVVVTVEPCIMCAASISLSNVPFVFAGCCNERFGGCGSTVTLDKAPNFQKTDLHIPNSLESLFRDASASIDERPVSAMEYDKHNHGFAFEPFEGTPSLHTYSLEYCGNSKGDSSMKCRDGFEVSQRFKFIWGIETNAAVEVLRRFYLRGNPKAPESKRERDLALDSNQTCT